VAGDLLLIATREDLIAGALTRAASVASEKWFADTVTAAGSAGDVRMVYHLDRLRRDPHFRSYWVQGMIPEFSSGAADLELGGEVRERRVLLRSSAGGAADESPTGALLGAVPEDAGFYRVWLRPSAEAARRLIEEKIFGAGSGAMVRGTAAPVVSEGGVAGSEANLETRIDEAAPPAEEHAGFRGVGAGEAMMEVESTRASDVFVGVDSALVLLAASNWDAAAVRSAFEDAEKSWWGASGRITVAVDGRWLVVGNSAGLVNSILSRRGRNGTGVSYAAGWRHSREFSGFERMTRLIDFPQIPPGSDDGGAREPMFFSENLASLGRALSRLESAEVVAHDSGSMLRETVVYRMGR